MKEFMEEKEVIVKHQHIPWPDYYCPKCDYEISNPHFNHEYMPKYCSECGQKIKKPLKKYPV
jgi:uncharacterized paraquat-inducible protein A